MLLAPAKGRLELPAHVRIFAVLVFGGLLGCCLSLYISQVWLSWVTAVVPLVFAAPETIRTMWVRYTYHPDRL
jgi:hypothetical protein